MPVMRKPVPWQQQHCAMIETGPATTMIGRACLVPARKGPRSWRGTHPQRLVQPAGCNGGDDAHQGDVGQRVARKYAANDDKRRGSGNTSRPH